MAATWRLIWLKGLLKKKKHDKDWKRRFLPVAALLLAADDDDVLLQVSLLAQPRPPLAVSPSLPFCRRPAARCRHQGLATGIFVFPLLQVYLMPGYRMPCSSSHEPLFLVFPRILPLHSPTHTPIGRASGRERG